MTGGGEWTPTNGVDLADRSNCPQADVCDRCHAGPGVAPPDGAGIVLAVVTVSTTVGVHCMTVCEACEDTLDTAVVLASILEVLEAVNRHCAHLGITLDVMAEAMEHGPAEN